MIIDSHYYADIDIDDIIDIDYYFTLAITPLRHYAIIDIITPLLIDYYAISHYAIDIDD
jgi:hypothetical protein